MKKKRINSLKAYRTQTRRHRLFVRLSQISLFFLFFFTWEFIVDQGIMNEFLISKPTKIYALFLEYVQNDALFHHVAISVQETLYGLIIGTVLGFVIATILYFSKTLYRILDPYLVVLNALPKTALAPTLIIWAGTGMRGIVVVSISLSLVITILSTYSYLSSVDPSLIKMMKTMKANPLQILWKVVYPSNIANFLAVIKINIGLSWVGVIVGEFLVSRGGIGYLVLYGGQVFRLDLVMMGVIVLSVIAFLMYEAVALLEFYFRKRMTRERKKIKTKEPNK